MPVLSEKVRQQVKDMLKDTKDSVKLMVFTQEIECPTCADNRQLMEEISSISDKINSEVYNFVLDKMAIESDLIRSDMINASEFPHLTNKYQVFSVPKVIINESIQFEGALPEQEFLKYVMKVGE